MPVEFQRVLTKKLLKLASKFIRKELPVTLADTLEMDMNSLPYARQVLLCSFAEEGALEINTFLRHYVLNTLEDGAQEWLKKRGFPIKNRQAATSP